MLLMIKVKCLTALISPESSLFLTTPQTTERETRLAKPYIQTIRSLTDCLCVPQFAGYSCNGTSHIVER